MDDKNLNNENESNEAKKLRVLGGGEEEQDDKHLKINKQKSDLPTSANPSRTVVAVSDTSEPRHKPYLRRTRVHNSEPE